MKTPLRHLFVWAALVVLAACSQPGSEHTRPRPSAAASISAIDPALDYHNPQAVCEGLARAIYTHDTSTDPYEGYSYIRTRPYLTARAYGADGGASVGRNSMQWQTWTEYKAHTEVSLSPFVGDGLIPTNPHQRMAATTATVTPIGTKGWRGETTVYTVVCTLTQAGGQWRVDQYSTEPIAGTDS